MKLQLKGVRLGFVGFALLAIACGDDGSGGTAASGGSGGTAGGGNSAGGNDTGGGGAAGGNDTGGGGNSGGNNAGGGGASGGAGGEGGAPLSSNGTPCAEGSECQSGACSDGVCCTTACAGVCLSCLAADTGDVDGECAPVLLGTDPGNDCEAGACAPGNCNGDGGCELEGVATECRAASGACDVAEFCDGSSIACGVDLLASAGSACGGYVCDGAMAACPTSCAQDLECAPDHFCADGSCLLGKRAFVSSSVQNGNLGGLVGADALCQNLAATAGLSGQFRAYMSDSTINAAARLTQAAIPYRLVTGTIVADNWADLTDGSLDTNLSLTEQGNTVSNNVFTWTGTNENGTLSTLSTNNCLDWQSADNANSGVSGFITNAAWAAFGVGACNGQRRLYCLQQ
jgi:hypothetical protein